MNSIKLHITRVLHFYLGKTYTPVVHKQLDNATGF